MDFSKLTSFAKKNYIAIIVATVVILAAVYYYKKMMVKKTEGFEGVIDYQLAQVHPAEKGCGCLAEFEHAKEPEVIKLMDIKPFEAQPGNSSLREVYEPSKNPPVPSETMPTVVNTMPAVVKTMPVVVNTMPNVVKPMPVVVG